MDVSDRWVLGAWGAAVAVGWGATLDAIFRTGGQRWEPFELVLVVGWILLMTVPIVVSLLWMRANGSSFLLQFWPAITGAGLLGAHVTVIGQFALDPALTYAAVWFGIGMIGFALTAEIASDYALVYRAAAAGNLAVVVGLLVAPVVRDVYPAAGLVFQAGPMLYHAATVD